MDDEGVPNQAAYDFHDVFSNSKNCFGPRCCQDSIVHHRKCRSTVSVWNAIIHKDQHLGK